MLTLSISIKPIVEGYGAVELIAPGPVVVDAPLTVVDVGNTVVTTVVEVPGV